MAIPANTNTNTFMQHAVHAAGVMVRGTVSVAVGATVGIPAAIATYFTTIIYGIGLQMCAGGASLTGPATAGGIVTYNLIGTFLFPVAVVGGLSVGIYTGVSVGRETYNAL